MLSDRRWLIRVSFITLCLMAFATPWVVWASQEALSGLFNAPALWVSPSFEPRRQFQVFLEQFDRPEAVILSWEGCTVDDPRLQKLSSALTSDEIAVDESRYRDLFPNVFTGFGAVRGLMEEPLDRSRSQAIARLRGTLVGPDGETSCAIVVISQQGAQYRELLLDLLLSRAEQVVEIPQDQFYLSGSIVEGVGIDTESMRSGIYAIPSALLSLILCLLCLRSPILAAPIFIVAIFGEGLVLAVCYLLGVQMNAVLMVLAPLIFILTVSSGVHLANYYRDEAAGQGIDGAVERAIKKGLRPCALAAMTTAIGLGSLAVSAVVPVRQFGALGAIGVLSSTFLMFLILPGVLSWRPVHVHAVENGLFHRGLQQVGLLIHRFAVPILVIGTGLMVFGAGGLTHVTTSVSVLSLFEEDSRVVHDYRWLEKNLGPLVPVELLIEFDDTITLDQVQRLDVVARVHAAARRIEGIGGTLSAATFLPPIPRSGGWRGTVRRTVYNARLARELPALMEAGYLAADDDGQTWRVVARTSALDRTDHSLTLDRLEKRIDRLLTELAAEGLTGVSISATGLMPLVQAGQEILLRDLVTSFVTAFAVVAVVMALTLRSLAAGMLAMLPNLFPVVVLFGTMGWLGQAVDIGTMMTASIALGIAVDDTLHFLIWYQRARRESQPAKEAMIGTLRHCGQAMLHTTIICSLGLMVYTLSGFVPTRRFALMMFALLSAALVGDLILLPALLIGPLGGWFGRQTPEAVKGEEM